MSTVAKGASRVVCARMVPCGSMIHPTPPQAPAGSTRLDERQNVADRTVATTPAVVAARVSEGMRSALRSGISIAGFLDVTDSETYLRGSRNRGMNV